MWQENNELQLSGPWIQAKGTEDAEESEFMYWARGQTQINLPKSCCFLL